jgi:two-component system sensor histidine kinase SenX3
VWTTEFVKNGDEEGAFELSVSACRESLVDGRLDSSQRLVLWMRDIGDKRRRDRFQREIISTTTHDLKGSLGAIAVSCDVLLESSSLIERSIDSEVSQKRMHALLERVASSANSAINLVEEFLSMRRIEEGALVMHPTVTSVSSVITKVIDSFVLTAKTRGISIDFISGHQAEILGCVDSLSFERVVSNLISNAIKFSAGGKRVELSLQRQDGGIILRVRDFGVGMESGDAKRLFNRYARLAAHKDVAGSGLGLFIVKCIVNAHGGNIDVTSAVGQGTTFEIFFPDTPPCNDQGELVCVDLA